jgi:hypothetical protein
MSTQKNKLPMCGRFAQFHSRDKFLAALAPDTPVSTTGDWHARYNVAPGTPVPLFHHHDDQLQLAPVCWGYAPAWWRAQGKPPLINARVETAASSRMLGKIWFAGQGINKSWAMRRELLSPSYTTRHDTTRLSDIPVARLT